MVKAAAENAVETDSWPARSLTFLSAVDELTGVHAFGCDEQFFAFLVPVGVAEVHDGERSTTARIVNDVLESNERDEGARVHERRVLL